MRFCIFCGMPLMNVQPEAVLKEPAAAPSDAPGNFGQDRPFVSPEVPVSEYIPPEAPINEYIPPEAPVNEYIPPEAPVAKKKTGIILSVILGVLLLGAITLAVIMMMGKNVSEARLADVQSELEAAQDELDLIKEDEAYYSQLEENSYGFEEIADFARQSNCGYASELFHVNQGIIILDPDDTRKTITLTAAFDDAVEISVDIYGYGADLNFSEDSWSGDTTTLYVDRDADDMEEGEVGITTVTFTNDLNSQTFDILIITLG